jgi:pilus assembly protein Flp/PilA
MLFAPNERGQGLIEYAMILSLVAAIVVFVIRMTGPKVGNNYSTINNSVP